MRYSAINLRSLPLHELLSAPLTAAIEAQQQASIGLVSFIQDIGFTSERDQAQSARMLEFQFEREGRDAEGNRVRLNSRLRIPLLAMVSLPHLEIDRLDVNLLVGLQEVSLREVSPRLEIAPELKERYPFLRGHHTLRVAPVSRTTVKGTTKTTRPYDLEISLVASSEELTDGVRRVLTALTSMMTEETREGVE